MANQKQKCPECLMVLAAVAAASIVFVGAVAIWYVPLWLMGGSR